MHPDTPLKTAGATESPPQWAAAEAADLQHPEDSGLAQVGFAAESAGTALHACSSSTATRRTWSSFVYSIWVLTNKGRKTLFLLLLCLLLQSLRFYVAHANAGIRNMCESPATSDIFRYPPESRTAAAVALAADKEDRLLHLLRGYGCAVILANLITTFLCSSMSQAPPAKP